MAEEEKNYETNARWSNVSWYPLNSCNILDFYDVEQIQHMVEDPMTHNEEIRRLSRMLYSCNGVLTNVVDYCTALPTLNSVVVAHGKSPSKKQTNKEIVKETLRLIRDRELVRDALHNVLVDGVYFAYFETRERPLRRDKSMSDWQVRNIIEINENKVMNASVVYLDPDYTRIIGIRNGSYVLSFDLDYFWRNGNEPAEDKLRRYPKEIRDAYKAWRENRGQQWVVLDTDKTIAVKFRAKRAEPYGRPLVLAAIDDILYDALMTKAKRKAIDETNKRIIYETFPEGKQKGESALTDKQQISQHETVRDAIKGTNGSGGVTTFFSVAAGTKLDTLKPDVSILEEGNSTDLRKNISLGLGFAASLLTGEGTSSFSAQENNLQLITAEIFNVIEMIVEELNKVINANIIRDNKYRVDVHYLPITYCNRKQFVEMAKDLYLQGKGSLSMWATAVGIGADAFFDMLDEELEADIEHKYPVHQTSFTYGADNNNGGRPVDEDTTNPKTLTTRANGGNSLPSPSD